MSINKINYNTLINLNSNSVELTLLLNEVLNQNILLEQQLSQTQKLSHQMRINNIYKAHENEFIIDDNIFDNDELE